MRSEFIECITVPAGVGGSLVPLAGVTATVYLVVDSSGTEAGSPTTPFADQTSGVLVSSLNTDVNGTISFFLENGDYNIHFHDSAARISDYVRAFSAVESDPTISLDALQATIASLQDRIWIAFVSDTASSESITNTSYTGALTPDKTSAISVPQPALIGVWYKALWSQTVSQAGRAAIFLNSNQAEIVAVGGSPPLKNAFPEAAMNTQTGISEQLVSSAMGLVSSAVASYSGDTSNGQALVIPPTSYYGIPTLSSETTQNLGGPCWIYADPGTYVVSVQFKTASGTVTVGDRQLRVGVAPF